MFFNEREKSVAVVKLGKRVFSGALILEIEVNDGVDERHYKSVHQNVGEEELQGYASRNYRNRLEKGASCNCVNTAAVSHVAYQNEHNLNKGNDVAYTIDRSAAVCSALVNIEHPAGKYVRGYKREINGRHCIEHK
jgi:hypothetical protein